MNNFDSLKNRLIQLNSDFIELITDTDTISSVSQDTFSKYKSTCTAATKQLSEDVVRVAVVGPIKSGKSTFVNSLFKNDYLKRGAGVITSIVTKIRCGSNLKATVSFKAWDEINQDIEQGLTLLPLGSQDTDDFRFDLRKESHREKLREALDSLRTEQLIVDDSRNLNTVLLSSYLKGYDRIKDIIAPDSVIKTYKNDDFSEHRTFTGDEIMAVYINDIQLEIATDSWNSAIEIADCQGSDSPNPLHLAMVQDYLSVTNLIVYVVSSRTGLRRADIKFLTMIKEMGIMDNMLFVINCDFSEHESIEEFSRLMGRIKEELSIIIPNPEVFTLSALYNLFSSKSRSDATGIELNKKDMQRLEQWEDEKEFTDLSFSESSRFGDVLNQRLTEKRYSLLLTNHIERLAIMVSGIKQRIVINSEILNRDSSSANDIISRIKGNQDKTGKVSSMIRSTLDGAIKKVNAELKREVDIYFDERSGTAISDLKKFIRNYEHTFTSDFNMSDKSNFTGNLYIVFQDFKQAVDTFMTETITPKILGFIKSNDKKLVETLYEMTRPYENMVENALAEYSSALDDFGIAVDIPDNNGSHDFPDIGSLKTAGGIKTPKASAVISYTARVRAESVIRFGLYSIVSFIKKTFKKQIADKTENEKMALKDGLKRIKQETVSNLVSHFLSYKENLKYQYFFKLSACVANSIYDIHTDSFNAYINDLETVSGLIDEKKQDKEKIVAELEAFRGTVHLIVSKIDTLKKDIAEM